MCDAVALAGSAFLVAIPPRRSRVADKNFWSLTTANGAITLSDVLTTSLLVGKSSACPYEIGSPGLYGEKAPPARVAAVMGATYARRL